MWLFFYSCTTFCIPPEIILILFLICLAFYVPYSKCLFFSSTPAVFFFNELFLTNTSENLSLPLFWLFVFFWTFLSVIPFRSVLVAFMAYCKAFALEISVIKGSRLTFFCMRSHFLLDPMSSSSRFIPLFWWRTFSRNSWENSLTRVSNTLVRFQRPWMFRKVYLCYHCSWLVAWLGMEC